MNRSIFVVSSALLVCCLLLATKTVVQAAAAPSENGGGGGGDSCPSSNDDAAYDSSSAAACSCDSSSSHKASARSEISYVLLAVSGTLEEGFELRQNMDYRPAHGSSGRVNATFLGKALVRGYKSFLDIKNPTWREYVDDSNDDGDSKNSILKTVNPALVPTGCDEHANRYAIYAVDSRQAILALAGEPRFLSITADMGLADLTAADDLTWPDIKALARAYAQDPKLSDIASSSNESHLPSVDRTAFLTVTSTWLKSTMVPNGIIRENDNEGIITDYPESVGLWSANTLNKHNKTHDTYPQGCGSNPAGQGQVTNVNTALDYNTCIDAAIRLQEAEYTTVDPDATGDHVLVGNFADFEFCAANGMRRCFDCKRSARYGTDGRTSIRFNKVLSACQLENLMIKAGVVNDDGSGGPKFPLKGGGCYLGD